MRVNRTCDGDYWGVLHRLGQQWDAGLIGREEYIAQAEAASQDMREQGHGNRPSTFVHMFLMYPDEPVWQRDLAEFILPVCSLRYFQELHAARRLPEASVWMLSGALYNRTAPDLVRYMHECGYVDASPTAAMTADWHPFQLTPITPQAVGFFLELGWRDYSRATFVVTNRGSYETRQTALTVHLTASRHRAAVLAILLSHDGGKTFRIPLSDLHWPHDMDMDTFAVLERFYSNQDLIVWANRSTSSIAISRTHFSTLWPHLFRYYGLFFCESEIQEALCYGDQFAWDLIAGDLPEQGIVTHDWLQETFHRTQSRRNWLRRYALLLSYNHATPHYLPHPMLEALDHYMVWQQPRARFWYSSPLKQRLKLLLLCARRHYGSTLPLKPLLAQIVGYVTWEHELEGLRVLPSRQQQQQQPGCGWTCILQ